MTISVPNPMRDWVEDRVESGRHASASDHVRDLIRRDQRVADAHDALAAALEEGERSGVSPRDIPGILADLRAERRGTGESS